MKLNAWKVYRSFGGKSFHLVHGQTIRKTRKKTEISNGRLEMI
jgi:Mor family transcriptional regulator